VKQALEANKLYVINDFSLRGPFCKSLTLSENGILDKGHYPTFMFIHLQYLLNYCFVYVGPGGGSVAEWLGTKLEIQVTGLSPVLTNSWCCS